MILSVSNGEVVYALVGTVAYRSVVMERNGRDGLGHVGLPSPLHWRDISSRCLASIFRMRVWRSCGAGDDGTGEVSRDELSASRLRFAQSASELAECSLFFLAVPTPVDEEHRPDLRPLLRACQMVGGVMKPGALIVIESTVYPGVTEEVCGPALAAASGLRSGIDFHLGYSPERINPGDKQHRLETIVKVIAAETRMPERLAAVYGAIVTAGLHRAPTISCRRRQGDREHQRDVNIALMNELAMIFDQLKISTRDVLTGGDQMELSAVRSRSRGGHCIGIDPYYLTAGRARGLFRT